MKRLFLFVVLLLASLGTALAAQTPVLPITVSNVTAQARVAEPVSVGIPVPLWANEYGGSEYCILAPDGTYRPHSFKVLTRWGGDRADTTKPIRWVLCTFLADVPARSTATYMVCAGAPPTPSTIGIQATASPASIDVNTGAATFSINRNAFRLFDCASVGGVQVATAGRIDMNGPGGVPMDTTVTETVLEDYSGPNAIRCVVRQRGTLGTGGLRFTCRWYFHATRTDVVVDFRLENPNAYGLLSPSISDGERHFDSLYLVQPVAGASPATQLELKQSFSKAAAAPLDLWPGFSCAGSTTPRHPGSIDLSGPAGGACVTVDRFWQNFPKGLRIQNGEIQIGLWPEWGNGPEYSGQYGGPAAATTDPLSKTNYRFEGGRWKTHRLVFNFHAGTVTSEAVAAEAERVNAPLVGLPTPSWFRISGATAGLFVERQQWTSVADQRYERFSDILVDDGAADLINGVRIGFPAHVRRGGTYGGNQSYGWDHYGDILWAEGYSAQHYDWTASFLNAFWRTGDYRFFDVGRDVTLSRRDYNQNHSTNTAEAWRGCQFYEKGWFHGNYTKGIESHNWIEGVLIHYVTTGDEGSREAAIDNLAFVLRQPPKNWSGWWGSRLLGWSVDNLMAGYAYLGDQVYLTEAGLGVKRYVTLEQQGGSRGCVLNPANGETTSWMENIVHIAACKYYLASRDATVLPLLTRMRNWFETVTVLPTGTWPNLTAAMVKEHWTPTSAKDLTVHHCWAMTESFAYSAVVFDSDADLELARRLFESTSRFWQRGPVFNPLNWSTAATFSPITFRPNQYPGTESKVLSNVLRWGGGYLAARALLN